MSTTAASTPVQTQYGCVWEEDFTYLDADGNAIDLAGYAARLQVRAEAARYGLTGAALIDKNSEDHPTEILLTTSPSHGATVCVVRLRIPVADVNLINPTNLRKVKGPGMGIQLYLIAEPTYVVPLAEGVVTCLGSTVR